MKRALNFLSIVLGFLLSSSLAYAELFPSEGPPGTTVTISGEGFGDFHNTQDNRVEFQGSPALIQSWDPDFILVKVPLQARSGPVIVINESSKREAGIFSVKDVRIANLEPSQAEAGSVLTVVGEHFGNTAGSRDPNTMFGVNQVLINGIRAEVRRWRPTKIKRSNSASGRFGFEKALLMESPFTTQLQKSHCSPYFSSILAIDSFNSIVSTPLFVSPFDFARTSSKVSSFSSNAKRQLLQSAQGSSCEQE
jgi:hypothetical protein